MNKQKEVEAAIKKQMKFNVVNDEFTLQGDKVYDLAQEIVKLFAIPVVRKSACSLRNGTICRYLLYNNECHCKEDCDFKQAVL